MATLKRKMKQRNSVDKDATVNRAGGEAFDIKCPATKLITMTGGSFFAEPNFYDGVGLTPRVMNGSSTDVSKKFDKMTARLNKNLEKSSAFADVSDLDEVSQEVIATFLDIANGDNPKDALVIANWLRNEMNIRLTPQVLLVLASRHEATKQFVREYASKIVVRPDEVKICFSVHRYFFGMKNLSNSLDKGLGDALSKFGERALLKYDTPDYPTWKNVLETLSRSKDKPLSHGVAKYFITGEVDKKETPIIAARKKLAECDTINDKAKKLISKSFANWEVVLSQFGNTPQVWEYLLEDGLVGYMALLRNLRNILEAGVNDAAIERVCEKLSNKEEVLNSKQLPFRYTMAYHILSPFYQSYSWNSDEEHNFTPADNSQVNKVLEAIEIATDHASENVPEIQGESWIFVDNSGSMTQPVSDKSKTTCMLAANTLAGIFARRSTGKAHLYAFGTDIAAVPFSKRNSSIDIAKRIISADTKGMSTNGYRCIQEVIAKAAKPDRIIIFTDMQVYGEGSMNGEWRKLLASSKNTWLHVVNLNGYGDTGVKEGNNVNLVGGFSEKIIPSLIKAEGGVSEDREEVAPTTTIEQIREKF